MEIIKGSIKALNQSSNTTYSQDASGKHRATQHITSLLSLSNGQVGLYKGRAYKLKKGDKVVLAAVEIPIARKSKVNTADIEVLAYQNLSQNCQEPELGQLMIRYVSGGFFILLGISMIFSALVSLGGGSATPNPLGLLIVLPVAAFGLWIIFPGILKHRAKRKLNAYLKAENS